MEFCYLDQPQLPHYPALPGLGPTSAEDG